MDAGSFAEEALDQLLEITTLLGDDMAAGLAAMGLTPPRAHLLYVLATDGPSPQRRLAEALVVTPRAVTTYVDDLVAAGLVTREPHPTDRRAALVTPTEAGHQTAEALLAGREELAEQLFADVAAHDLAVLVRSLDSALDRLRVLAQEREQS